MEPGGEGFSWEPSLVWAGMGVRGGTVVPAAEKVQAGPREGPGGTRRGPDGRGAGRVWLRAQQPWGGSGRHQQGSLVCSGGLARPQARASCRYAGTQVAHSLRLDRSHAFWKPIPPQVALGIWCGLEAPLGPELHLVSREGLGGILDQWTLSFQPE